MTGNLCCYFHLRLLRCMMHHHDTFLLYCSGHNSPLHATEALQAGLDCIMGKANTKLLAPI